MQENSNKTVRNNELPLDLYSILRALVKDWWMIITAGIIGAMLAYIMAGSAYTASYSSSMTFIVSAKGTTSNLANLTATNEMAETFSEVLNSRLMKKKVQQELNLGSLPGKIKTTVVEETNLMTLSVSADSPEHAFKIMKSILNNYSEITDHVMSNVILDVLEAPEVPLEPDNPVYAIDMMKLYALAGMALMSVLLALIDYLKDDIKNENEVEQKLDTNLFGTIYHEVKNKTIRSKFKKNKKGLLITDPTCSFMFVENYKKIRTKLMYKTKQEQGKVILITSVMENEGKTTVAANIAVALAQKSDKVILIDGDMRRPAIHKILQKTQESNREIGEYLEGNVPMKDILSYDAKLGLYLMIGSKHYANSTEIVSGERMKNLIKSVRKIADYVVIDSPPTSLMADAEILAEYADVSLLVVRQGMASASYINDAIDILEDGHSELLGCVYNDVKTGVFSGKKVFGGYGYGYGKYGKYKYGKRYHRYGNYSNYVYGAETYQAYDRADIIEPTEELKLHEE